MQQARSLGQGVSAGKWPRGACQRQQAPPASTVSLHCSVVTVATTKSKAATVWGELGGVKAEVMLDSGSSVSLVQEQMLSGIKDFECVRSCARHLKLVTGSGAELPVLGHIRSSIRIGEIKLLHMFVVVESLVASVILGVDFLHENGLVLDFTQTPVHVRQATVGYCSITSLRETPGDAVDECAVPNFRKTSSVELPECVGSEFSAILEQYQDLFNRGHLSLYS